jgi:nucleotide-binding universal stress UspA family protein
MSGLYDRILIPLDGSEVANQALPHAQQLAAQSGAELVLLRVVPNLKSEVTIKNNLPYVELKVEQQQYLVDHATRWLQRLADDLEMQGIKAQVVTDVGEAAEKIVDYSVAGNIDMIVMSTHGRSGLARWRYGSVATKVMAAVKCPVLLVHSQLAESLGEHERQQPAATA